MTGDQMGTLGVGIVIGVLAVVIGGVVLTGLALLWTAGFWGKVAAALLALFGTGLALMQLGFERCIEERRRERYGLDGGA